MNKQRNYNNKQLEKIQINVYIISKAKKKVRTTVEISKCKPQQKHEKLKE